MYSKNYLILMKKIKLFSEFSNFLIYLYHKIIPTQLRKKLTMQIWKTAIIAEKD